MSVEEKQDRAEAKIWLIKNNHNIQASIGENGLASLIEEAFVEGCKKYHGTLLALKDEVCGLENNISRLEDSIEELESQISERTDINDISVENL